MGRTIFIGDIHGCYAELIALLEKIRVRQDDQVVSLGDMTRKGPEPDRCLELWRERRYLAVRGNQEAKLLKRPKGLLTRWLMSASDRRVLRRKNLVAEIRRWPLHLDFPAIGAVAVHGGILPNGKRFHAGLVTRSAIHLRHIRRNAKGRWAPVKKGRERHSDPFWADIWAGDRIILYGHTPREKALVHERAIGLDTGCVYGGKLTAAVFERKGSWRLVSVPALRRYAR